jgi:SAM-dependent methyltransferase
MEHREYRGLHAEWYERVSASMGPSPEVDFLAAKVKALGQPALELGSGTGKILIPLLEQGLDVIGVDTSVEMTARCLAACTAKNVRAEIYEQSMVELDLPHRFRVIFLDSGGWACLPMTGTSIGPSSGSWRTWNPADISSTPSNSCRLLTKTTIGGRATGSRAPATS